MTQISNGAGELRYEERMQHGAKGLNVWHLEVDPNNRGRGMGKSLLLQVVDIAQRDRYEWVTVNMGGGLPAKRMLESCGFTVMSCNDDPDLDEQDRHVDGYRDIWFDEWVGFPEAVSEAEIDEWTGWTG